MSANQHALPETDVVVVGAGFTGLYALYKLRQFNLRVQAFEVGSGVGGVWYWNRYPGARTDSPSQIYQYWFSDELLADWNWSERFIAQEETERYLNHVADRFDLRRDICFSTRVTAATFDESTQRWIVETDTGKRVSAQFLIMGSGGLTEPVTPDFPGKDSFAGECYHTSRRPREPVDFSGKRVGVIGTGATGIQVIQTIQDKVGHLTVFQRTAHYTIPMRNPKLDDAARTEMRAKYPELRHFVQTTTTGFDFNPDPRGYFEMSPEERRAQMERLWADGSLIFWVGAFADTLMNAEANVEISDFVREKIRARVKDPAIADKLTPRGYGFGTRRVPLETQYYEAFNRPNCTLVDIAASPIEAITPTGVKTRDGEYPLDILIYATGFDAGTGALTRIDMRGRDGVLLRDSWKEGIHSFMGLQVRGFPNMFMVMAPMSPAAAFCNVPTCSQQQIDWIVDCMDFVRAEGRRAIEPSAAAEAQWVAHHDEVANATLIPQTDSWYMGANIKGKRRSLLAYAGGVGVYKQFCDDVKAKRYEGLELV